jgi:hypothetical protein
MKYRNVIIKCKSEDASDLQKHLFKLKYHWTDFDNKHRHVKDFSFVDRYIYFVIKNDSSIHYTFFPTDHNLKLLDYPRFIRKEKLLKLKNV